MAELVIFAPVHQGGRSLTPRYPHIVEHASVLTDGNGRVDGAIANHRWTKTTLQLPQVRS